MPITAGPALADTITCESKGGRESYCRTNTHGGVYLQTQLSGNGCYQGVIALAGLQGLAAGSNELVVGGG